MARGKYSPTVSAAYQANQNWWNAYAYAGRNPDDFVQYDADGFDSYGYNDKDVDRAGNHENDYLHSDAPFTYDGPDGDWNNAYDAALDAWGFDGVTPVRK
jgi:hypothetical protein